jgi:hypothetical protein
LLPKIEDREGVPFVLRFKGKLRQIIVIEINRLTLPFHERAPPGHVVGIEERNVIPRIMVSYRHACLLISTKHRSLLVIVEVSWRFRS